MRNASKPLILRIREQDPLKQGLKQVYSKKKEIISGIREQDPLKQGLKQSEVPQLRYDVEFASKIH